MAYAERVPSPKGDYYRGRYMDEEGSWVSVRDGQGRVIHFPLKQEAKDAANDRESDVRNDRTPKPSSETTFGEWAEEWYEGLSLAWSTMAGRRRHLDDHLLGSFGEVRLADIDEAMIGRWEMKERRAGKKPASIATWRGTLQTCLEDAVPRHIGHNPARRKGNRGKRAGKAKGRGPEKPFTNALGVLLISERMAILTGRDDEFVMGETSFWAALRLGELVGLEREYLRPEGLRVEWQLHQLDVQKAADGESEHLAAMRAEAPGGLLRCPPKDNSFGDVILASFMTAMLGDFAAVRPERACPCHGSAYLFRGAGVPSGGRAAEGTVTLADVAVIAGVSATTARKALAGEGGVSEAVRRRVRETAAATGFARRRPAGGPAWHWRSSAFEALVKAAATGQLPPKAPLPRRPVPLGGEWPGTRLRGPGAIGRATVRWEPVARGLTPHLMARHSMRTLMEEKRIPHIMSETHLRHDIPGVSGAYRHVTDNMRAELVAMMTAEHERALDARLAMSPRSPVAVLDAMLLERAEARKIKAVSRFSPGSENGVLPFPSGTATEVQRNARA
jgi:hypothetical protein